MAFSSQFDPWIVPRTHVSLYRLAWAQLAPCQEHPGLRPARSHAAPAALKRRERSPTRAFPPRSALWGQSADFSCGAPFARRQPVKRPATLGTGRRRQHRITQRVCTPRRRTRSVVLHPAPQRRIFSLLMERSQHVPSTPQRAPTLPSHGWPTPRCSPRASPPPPHHKVIPNFSGMPCPETGRTGNFSASAPRPPNHVFLATPSPTWEGRADATPECAADPAD